MHRRLLALLAIVPLALLAAGCGGGASSPGVADVASTAATTTTNAATQSSLLAFSQCMRSHGVPGFPDPQHFAGGNVKLTIHDTGSPHLQTAMRACGQLLPSGGPGSQSTAEETRVRVADGLSFARCMRSHGIGNFPDPTAAGDLSVEMVQAQGIDVHSPAVLRVVQKCLPASHGALTAAKVREAIANAGH